MSDRVAAPSGLAGRSAFGLRAVDATALFGALLWSVAALAGWASPVGRILALAPLVLVPLGLGAAATPPFDGVAGRCVDAAVALQPLGATLLLGSLLSPVDGPVAAAMAAGWLPATAAMGAAAAVRTRERGLEPLSETLVDAGLGYASVGAVALVAYHLGVTLWFEPVIVLLTAVHFHYAGFVLPVATGLVGRTVDQGAETTYRAVAAGVLTGPALIAVGIAFSPAFEVVAVGAFTAAVAVLGGYVAVRVAPRRPRTQGVLLVASALCLPVSMLLALAFAVGSATGATRPTIDTMVRLHGSLNAFGFALLGLVGWRLAVPERGRAAMD